MGRHVFHEIYLHFNWHTNGDLPLLPGDLESLTHTALKAKCHRIKGAYLHGLGGIDKRAPVKPAGGTSAGATV